MNGSLLATGFMSVSRGWRSLFGCSTGIRTKGSLWPFFLDLYHRVSEEGDVRCHLYADDWPNTPELDSGVFSSPSCDLKGSQCGGI